VQKNHANKSDEYRNIEDEFKPLTLSSRHKFFQIVDFEFFFILKVDKSKTKKNKNPDEYYHTDKLFTKL